MYIHPHGACRILEYIKSSTPQFGAQKQDMKHRWYGCAYVDSSNCCALYVTSNVMLKIHTDVVKMLVQIKGKERKGWYNSTRREEMQMPSVNVK